MRNNKASLEYIKYALRIVEDYCIFTYRGQFIKESDYDKRIDTPLALFYTLSSGSAGGLDKWCSPARLPPRHFWPF